MGDRQMRHTTLVEAFLLVHDGKRHLSPVCGTWKASTDGMMLLIHGETCLVIQGQRVDVEVAAAVVVSLLCENCCCDSCNFPYGPLMVPAMARVNRSHAPVAVMGLC